MVGLGPRERTARSRSRGADRAFRAAFLVALLAVLLLPSAIDAQPDAGNAAPPPPPPPADAGAPANAGETPGDDAIVLNFEKADIREVVHSLAGALGINYLLDPRVEGQVTIRTAPTGKSSRSFHGSRLKNSHQPRNSRAPRLTAANSIMNFTKSFRNSN